MKVVPKNLYPSTSEQKVLSEKNPKQLDAQITAFNCLSMGLKLPKEIQAKKCFKVNAKKDDSISNSNYGALFMDNFQLAFIHSSAWMQFGDTLQQAWMKNESYLLYYVLDLVFWFGFSVAF